MSTDVEFWAHVTSPSVRKQALAIVYSVFGHTKDAEDILHDAILKGLTFLNTHDPAKGSLTNWFRSVLYNMAHDHMRGQYRRYLNTRPVAPEELAKMGGMPATTDALSPQEMRDRIAVIAHVLPVVTDQHRRIWELHHVEGMSTPQIATLLDIPVNTVCTSLARVREKMRKAAGLQQDAA